jgi:hypothetical protein
MCQRTSRKGYMRVDLGKATATVASLVLRAFTGHPSFWERGAYFATQRNGDRSDNSVENLMWGYKWGRWE